MVTSFKYLVRVISAADNDSPEVVRNLEKARAVCQMLTSILSREGAAMQVPGFFFKAVVQSVLLFDTETWVVTVGNQLLSFYLNCRMFGFQSHLLPILFRMHELIIFCSRLNILPSLFAKLLQYEVKKRLKKAEQLTSFYDCQRYIELFACKAVIITHNYYTI